MGNPNGKSGGFDVGTGSFENIHIALALSIIGAVLAYCWFYDQKLLSQGATEYSTWGKVGFCSIFVGMVGGVYLQQALFHDQMRLRAVVASIIVLPLLFYSCVPIIVPFHTPKKRPAIVESPQPADTATQSGPR